MRVQQHTPWCTGEQEPEAHWHHGSMTYTPTYRYTYSPAVPRSHTARTERNAITRMCECMCNSTPPGVQGSRSQKPTGTMGQQHTRPHTDTHTHLPSPGRTQATLNVNTCMREYVCSSTPPWCKGEQEPEANWHHGLTTYTSTYRYTYLACRPQGAHGPLRMKCQHAHV